LNIAELTSKTEGTEGIAYYSISPACGWKLVVLDTYDISVTGWPPDHPHHQEAALILDEHNINEV
jgi:hypothetical protein